MARRGSGLENVTKLRRKLRRMDPAVTKEIKDVVKFGLYAIQRDALGLVPVDTGDLAHSITVQISKDGFTGIVGPGVKTAEMVRRKTRDYKRGKLGSAFAHNSQKVVLNQAKKDDLMQFFKGYWIEFGTKGNADLNLPPQPARPFMGPAYEANKDWIKEQSRRAINRVLERVSKGS